MLIKAVSETVFIKICGIPKCYWEEWSIKTDSFESIQKDDIVKIIIIFDDGNTKILKIPSVIVPIDIISPGAEYPS